MTKIIGLMSGTSVDGIDAALVEISGNYVDLAVKLLAKQTYAYSKTLREQILAVCSGEPIDLATLAELDDAIAAQFAIGAKKIQEGNPPAQLIGSHGQTVFHRPPKEGKIGVSIQLGRGEVIANLTNIPTVSNFRAADLAAGGQGAPLVPKIDAYLLGDTNKYRTIQNIGGMGNLTYIPAQKEINWEQGVCGWDTGPGNVLLDLAVHRLTDGSQNLDYDGNWARSGKICQPLVDGWLQQDFFQQPPPKSTGRELFGEAYLEQCWEDAALFRLSEADWLATLTELTVASITHSYSNFLPRIPDEVLLCGGGSRNLYLKQRLKEVLAPAKVLTTDEVGLSGDYKEAIAFAVLAHWRYNCSLPGNLPQVTGAKKPMLLGEINRPII